MDITGWYLGVRRSSDHLSRASTDSSRDACHTEVCALSNGRNFVCDGRIFAWKHGVGYGREADAFDLGFYFRSGASEAMGPDWQAAEAI